MRKKAPVTVPSCTLIVAPEMQMCPGYSQWNRSTS
jgi:hypothetical protein